MQLAEDGLLADCTFVSLEFLCLAQGLARTRGSGLVTSNYYLSWLNTDVPHFFFYRIFAMLGGFLFILGTLQCIVNPLHNNLQVHFLKNVNSVFHQPADA